MAFDVGSIAAKMTLNIANFSSNLDLAQKSAHQMARETSKAFQFGDGLTSVGSSLTKFVTVPLLGITAAAVKVGNDFEQQMSRVKAISGATAAEFEALQTQAIKLGADTSFSAREAAAGMENMASAGFDVKTIMSAMPGVLDLAAVSGGDVALASDAMATAMNAFGLEGKEAAHVADVFARAAADTNAEALDMAEAMKYIAPVSKAMGISLEETAAAIGIMSDAGIKGSQAGTTLRGALTRLARPTKDMYGSMEELGISFYDAEGNMVSLKDQMGLLKNATANLTQEEKNRHLVTLYGKESLSGMLALMDAGPESIDKLTQSLINSDGAAREMADIMMDNVPMAFEEMMGAFESAGIIIQQILAPALISIAQTIGGMVDAFVNAPPVVQKTIVVFGGLLAAIGPVLVVVGSLIKFIADIKIAFAVLGVAGISLTSVIWIVVGVVVALGAVFAAMYANSEKFRNGVHKLGESIKSALITSLEWLKKVMESIMPTLKQFAGWLGDKLAVVAVVVSEALKVVGHWIGVMAQKASAAIGSGLAEFVKWLEKLKAVLSDKLADAIPVINDMMDRMGGVFGKTGAIVGVLVSIVTKIGLAFMGITGPIGIAISLLTWFLSSWAKTGDLSTDGIVQVFDDLAKTISYLADKITEYLPILVDVAMDIIQKLVEGIIAALPLIIDVAIKIIETLTTGIIKLLDMLMPIAFKILETLVKGIAKAIPLIVEVGAKVMETLVKAITTLLPILINVAVQLITTLVEGIVTLLPLLIEVAGNLVRTLVEGLVSVLPLLLNAGLTLLVAIIEGIMVALPQLIETAVQLITMLLEVFVEALPQLIEMGIQLLMSLIDGILQVLPVLIESLLTIIVEIINQFVQALPMLIEAGIQLLTALIQGILQVFPLVVDAIIQITIAILQALWEALPSILSAGWEIVKALAAGILQLAWEAIKAIGFIISAILTAVWELIKMMVTKGWELVVELAKGIVSAIGSVIKAIAEIVAAIIKGIVNIFGEVLSNGKEITGRLASGIGDAIGKVTSAIGRVIKGIKDALSDAVSSMWDFGANIVSGIANGIGDTASAVWNKAKEMADGIGASIKNALNINSPSKVTYELGGFTTSGMIGGILSLKNKLQNALSEISTMVVDGLTTAEADLNGNVTIVPNTSAFEAMSYANSMLDSAKQRILDLLDEQDEPDDKDGPEPQPEPVTNVNIENIVVRDDNDIEQITRGLYSNSIKTIESLGDAQRR